MKTNVALNMNQIVKEFSGVKALGGVSFTAYAGEIHSICGENGAGKSTLMKVLSGFYPDGSFSGTLEVFGQPVAFTNTQASELAGISIVHQELSMIQEMTVGENIFLGKEPTSFGRILWDEIYSKSQDLLNQLGLKISAREYIKNLGIGQQQLVEIAKALSQNPKILLLDEPTSALTETEVTLLLKLLNDLKRSGVCSILISHKLQEVFSVSDRITVLRDGKTIATHLVKETSEKQIISEMVGRELNQLFPPRKALPPEIKAQIRLEVKDWCVPSPTHPDRQLLEHLNLTVKAGEILGIAGLMGSGRSEFLLSLVGADFKKSKGSLKIDGKEVSIQHPQTAIKKGLCLVTEDRKRFGLILANPIAENMTLSSLKQLFPRQFLNLAKEFSVAKKYGADFKVKAASLSAEVKTLSGGNQQKVVLAKCLMTQPNILLLDEPTRGIDVGARFEIYDLMNDLAAKGLAIVMVSSELPELLGMSDRILVMNNGKIQAEFSHAEATQEKIMQAAVQTNAQSQGHSL